MQRAIAFSALPMKTFKRERAHGRPVNFPTAADTIAAANNFWIDPESPAPPPPPGFGILFYESHRTIGSRGGGSRMARVLRHIKLQRRQLVGKNEKEERTFLYGPNSPRGKPRGGMIEGEEDPSEEFH